MGVQLSRYEQDNNTLLPDAAKIAILLNETKGPLQQHLQLQAGNVATLAQIRSMVIEYYRATASFTRLQAITSGSKNQGPAPMDIGATWYNKGKGNARAKESTTKAKATATTGTTTATRTTKEEKGSTTNNRLDKETHSKVNMDMAKEKDTATNNRLDKETHSKDNMDMAKEKDTATKEKAKDTTTTNKEEQEQQENKQQMFATDVDNQDTTQSGDLQL